VGMKIVAPQHELMLISEEGVVIRVKAEDISKLGRSTQGVKVMNVSEADHVCAIARVSGGKKKVAARVADGQGTLPVADEGAEPAPAPVTGDEREDEVDDLVAEEFEDTDESEEDE
jgi:DNA gyrase subunit A